MSEKITLNIPFKVDLREALVLEVDSILLNWRDKRIEIHLGDGNVQNKIEYIDSKDDPQATNFMVVLNKANLSTKSLHKRIMERLVTDGRIAGTIGGTPN